MSTAKFRFRPTTFLPAALGTDFTPSLSMRSHDQLAVDHRRRGARFTGRHLLIEHQGLVVDRLQQELDPQLAEPAVDPAHMADVASRSST